MSNQEFAPDLDLIGHTLGLCETEEAARIAESLRNSPELQRQCAELNAILKRLETCHAEPCCPELSQRILAACRTRPQLRLHGASEKNLESGETAPVRGGPMISLKELLSLAAAVALFVALFGPAYQNSKNAAMQTACLNNFRSLGQANAVYASANARMLPFSDGPAVPWLATASGQPALSNSRHAYLLLRLGYVDQPGRFICPARPGDRAMSMDQVRQHRDFLSVQNNSYSTQLLTQAMPAEFSDPAAPIMGDQNPRFEDRRFRPRTQSNSDSHGDAAGQNVLRNDGGAAWTNRANVGLHGDDIFKLADLSNYTGYERPQSTTDAFLVP